MRIRLAVPKDEFFTLSRMRGVVMAALAVSSARGRLRVLVNDSGDPATAGEIEYFRRIIRWLDLCRPDDIRFQSRFLVRYREAAARFITGGAAYCDAPDRDGRRSVRFRLPPPERIGSVLRSAGPVDLPLDPKAPVIVSNRGVRFSRAGMRRRSAALAGMHDLTLLDDAGTILFRLNDELDEILRGGVSRIRGASKAVFTRFQVVCSDMLFHNEQPVPLDSLSDPILLDGGGLPTDLLANTLDDIVFGTSAVFRPTGDPMAAAQQTLLFAALGYPPPAVVELPPVTPDEPGVDRLRREGYLPDAVISVLAQTGYTTGQRPARRSVNALIERFKLDRISARPAVFDREFLIRHNREDLHDLPPETFAFMAAPFCRPLSSRPDYPQLAALMQPLTACLADARRWPLIFCQWDISPEERERRRPENETYREALRAFADELDRLAEADAAEIRQLLNELEHRYDLVRGTLRRPITLALTGLEIDPDVALLVRLLGPGEAASRLRDIL